MNSAMFCPCDFCNVFLLMHCTSDLFLSWNYWYCILYLALYFVLSILYFITYSLYWYCFFGICMCAWYMLLNTYLLTHLYHTPWAHLQYCNVPVGLFRWRLLATRTWCRPAYRYPILNMLQSWQTWRLHCVTASRNLRYTSVAIVRRLSSPDHSEICCHVVSYGIASSKNRKTHLCGQLQAMRHRSSARKSKTSAAVVSGFGAVVATYTVSQKRPTFGLL